MFRVGQKVVCVAGSSMHVRASEGYIYPTNTDVYTIRGMYRDGSGNTQLLLQEIKNKPMETNVGTREPGFNARYFRPVVERKTDISIFTAMLNPAKKKRRADRPVTVS